MSGRRYNVEHDDSTFMSTVMEPSLETRLEDEEYTTVDTIGKVTTKFANLTDWQWNHIKNFNLEGQKCLLDFWYQPKKEGIHCNSTWDSFTCWPPTPAGTDLHMPCPLMFRVPHVGNLAHRICNEDGLWVYGNWSNYTECYNAYVAFNGHPDPFVTEQPLNEKAIAQAVIMRDIYFIGSIISLVLLVITLFIFCFFKSLQCSRVSIHKNLVLSFILRFIIILVMFEPFVSENLVDSYRTIEWLCKLLTALQQYSVIANIFWMFVEGLFLYSRIALAFNKEPHFAIFYAIGWGGPIPFTITWALCMHFFINDLPSEYICWQGWSQSVFKWIIVTPILAAFAVNVFFLVNIIRILITKLTATNTVETAQVRKAVKATVVLFPLLGLTNLLFFWKPEDEGAADTAYYITNAVLHSSQGIFVAVIYCFLNGEVQAAIQKKWQRYKMQRLNEQNYRRRTSHTSSFFLSQSEVLLFLAFGRKVHAARTPKSKSQKSESQNGSIEMTESHQWQTVPPSDMNSNASYV